MRKSLIIIFFLVCNEVNAYVGPGAGFVIGGVSGILLIVIFSILFTIVVLPFSFFIKEFIYKKPEHKPLKNRVIIIGFDGLDPEILNRYIESGLIKNINKFFINKLKTTNPAISPVAWSSFVTGVNPGKHNIFDFLKKNHSTHSLQLSLTDINYTEKKFRSLRKSRSFINILKDYRIPCYCIRIPGTFPPQEQICGYLLSGFPCPDIKGTQGEYILLSWNTNNFSADITGPKIKNEILKVKITGSINKEKREVEINLQNKKIILKEREYSDWVEVVFGDVSAITRFLLLSIEPYVKIYLTPLNVNPLKPVFPVSQPNVYSVYLSKKLGLFSTLGMAEDTAALKQGIIDKADYLNQCYIYQKEREKIFYDILDKFDKGVFTFVFDIPDRIQHIFIDEDEVIKELYCYIDNFVLKIIEKLKDSEDYYLIIISDHGISNYRRSFNLNTFLLKNGYLILQKEVDKLDLSFADWDKTKAYSFGFNGIYLNLKDSGSQSIALIKQEIKDKLLNLSDNGIKPVNSVYFKEEIYKGPYLDNAPDIIIGYNKGYRTSFESAKGIIEEKIISDNLLCWVGDHSIDPEFVKGVCITNFTQKADPEIIDIAP
ncbi:MAG: alkaline phosphatase family protein, partial [Candidatus Hydrogenedentota bacterium]